jgi:hypothetical protein
MNELDQLMPGEILRDSFAAAIYEICRREPCAHVLEIGSANGDGSTEAFVAGLSENPRHPQLYCLEVSEARLLALRQRYRPCNFLRALHVSSVALDKFPNAEQVTHFYNTTRTHLNLYPLERVLGWLERDRQYLIDHPAINLDGIELLKREPGVEAFDVVLIDGSEFAGEADLNAAYGAGVVMLDDINAHKNWRNFHRLKNDAAYQVFDCDWNLRNGYAIFKKR